MPDYNKVKAVNSTYVPQYVGSNFNEIKSIADTLDERYRQNRSLADKVAISLAQEQYLDQDKDIKQGIADNIQNQIDAVSSSPENFENSSAAVSQLARDFMTNPDRIAALENKRRVDEAKALIQQYGKDAYNFGNDDPFNFSTKDQEGNTRMFTGQIEKLADFDARKESLFNDMQADAVGGKLTKSDMEGFIKTTDWSGISNTKVKTYLDNALARYKQTTEYDQEKRKMLKEYPEAAEMITTSDGRTIPMYEEAIRNNILSVGKERIFGRTNTDRQQDPMAVLKAKAALDQEVQRTLTTAKTGVVPNTLLAPTPLDNMSFSGGKAVKRVADPQNQLVRGRGGEDRKEVPRDLLTGKPIKLGLRFGDAKEVPLDTTDPAYEYLDKFISTQKQFGNDLTGLSQEEVVNRFNNAREDLKKVSFVTVNPSLDVKESLKKEIIGEAGGGLAGRQLYLMDGQGVKQGGDLTSVAKGLGYSGADDPSFDKALKATEDFTIQPFNPFNDNLAGAYSAGIKRADGGYQRVLISPNQEQAQYYKRSQALGKAALTGEPVIGWTEGETMQGADGNSYLVKYDAIPVLTEATTENGKKGKFDVKIQKYLTDRDGNPVATLYADSQGTKIDFSLQDIANLDTEDFKNSEFFNSRLTATKPSNVQ